LQSPQGSQVYIELQNQSKSAQLPLKVARVGFVATSLAEAIKLLQAAVKQLQKQPQADAWEHPQGIYYRKTGLLLEGKVVALFPGQTANLFTATDGKCSTCDRGFQCRTV